MFELVLGVLSRLSHEQPVALVLEDVHWADSASLDLLAFLVRNQRTERLATIVDFRSDKLADQVLDITGKRPAAALSRVLHDRSQGNPLFTDELLAGGPGDELPASLPDALLVRVRRLSDRGREIVGMAAVAGRTVDHRLLAALEVMTSAELIAALRDAVAKQVLAGIHQAGTSGRS